MSINFENISLLVSGCMDLLTNESVLRLHGLIWTASLCSGCMDLYDHHFVLRLHRPIGLLFCAQATWAYMISVMVCILHSGHMDLFCRCELTAQRDFGFAILHSGHMDLYNCHFALRSHRPILLSFWLRLHGPI